MNRYILALDQGTTSSRAIVFGHDGRVVSQAQREFEQIYPRPGIVEHDPDAIWQTQVAVAREALAASGLAAAEIAAIGIANQRETTILWERSTGRPVANAVVWQSRASLGICERLKSQGLEPLFRSKTGLLLDPYFSGSKIKYLLDARPELRAGGARGEILFGTVDTFLLWRLTGGRRHVTDASNASRTLLFNLHSLDWDSELLEILQVPRAMLPDVLSSSEVYGETDGQLFGAPIPIAAAIGDQQAALFGQNCFHPGTSKITYGTGCFLLLNTGARAAPSQHGLLTSVAWKRNQEAVYCLEGSIFIAGAVVQWLRDGLGLIASAPEVGSLAASVSDSGGVYFVPAFVGLGAPYWNPYARGTILGLTRGTRRAHIARAAIESIAYQARAVLAAMQQDAGLSLREVRVDGGAAANNLLLQFQADLLGVPVRRPAVLETTALGAAYLAGLAVGYWEDAPAMAANWTLDREFLPAMPLEQREKLYRGWQKAVSRSLDWEER